MCFIMLHLIKYLRQHHYTTYSNMKSLQYRIMTLISYKTPYVNRNVCLFFVCYKETFVHLTYKVTPNRSIRIIIYLSNAMRSLKQKNQNCHIMIITRYVDYIKIMCIFLIVCLYMHCRWT